MADRPEHKSRQIAVGLLWNEKRQLLLCRMSPDHGVFPGQWGFPGGGLEPGETAEQALRRELKEELDVAVGTVCPAFSKSGEYTKTFASGDARRIHMTFLLFHCETLGQPITLNEEWVEWRWVSEEDASNLDLNKETQDTLARIGSWSAAATSCRAGRRS